MLDCLARQTTNLINLSSRDDNLPRGANGCVICLETPACPSCPSGQVCNLSSQTCDTCSTVSCVASSSAYMDTSSSDKKTPKVSTSNHMIGPLIGAIIAGILVIALSVFLFFFLRKRRRMKQEQANFVNKVNDQEKLGTASFISVNNSTSTSPNLMYNNSTFSKHQSFNPRYTGISATTNGDDETATNYEEPLTIQQQLNYIKKQQLKLQREEIRERQRQYKQQQQQQQQQNLNSPALVHQVAGSPTSPTSYDPYLRYVTENGQLNKPSPSSSLQHIGHASTASEFSVNSVDIRDGHASNIVPIAYIPGVTSNFYPTFASSPTSNRSNNNNNNINSPKSIFAFSTAQPQRLSVAPTDSMISYDPRISQIPIHSAMTAARAQPQLVVNMKYQNSVDPDAISIEPDLDRRPEELNSLKSCNKSNNSFSDVDSVRSKGLDNELYNQIESYLVHDSSGISSVPTTLNGSSSSDTNNYNNNNNNSNTNNNNNNDTTRPVSTATRASSGTPRSSWRTQMPAQRNSQRSSPSILSQRHSQQRSSSRLSQQRNSQQPYHHRQSLRDSNSDDIWRLQPFDYPVVFDKDDDISFVNK